MLAAEDETQPTVIDGQQRLTTLMVLLSALRDASLERGMAQHAQQIQQRLIADDFADGDARFKFKTGAVNWPVFRDFVLRHPSDEKRKTVDQSTSLDPETRSRNAALLQNAARMGAHLEKHLESLTREGQINWLRKFTKNVLERVEIVVIEVRQLADAFLLFETLNDRGLQLSAADLLKSHLLGQIAKAASEEEVDEAALAWDGMLEDLGAHVDVSRFLRHYLLGYLPAVKKDEVFGHFKSLIGKRDALGVLDEIRAVAKLYGEFENPTKVAHGPTRSALEDLQTLRAMTCYIALLPARRYLSQADFVGFARLAEVLTFRYSTVVGLGTNELERKYRDAAQSLIASEGAELDKARQILIAAMPESHTFQLAFQSMRMGTQYLLRYTLRRMEEHLTPVLEKKLQTNSLVHIEHVMPQTLTREWKESLGTDSVERHAEYLNKYGNLTLFYSGLNIPASNKTFAEKQSFYEKSQVELTKRLAEWSNWGLDAIDERQRQLAALADELWAVPGTTVGAESATSTSARAEFQTRLGTLWREVEPYCRESTPEEIQTFAERLPKHMARGPEAEVASGLAQRLLRMLNSWEVLDGGARFVLSGAVSYFLELEDVMPDRTVGGLQDDEHVISAAEEALLTAMPKSREKR